MRRWLVVGGVALLILVAGLAFVVANANRYLNEHRDWVAERVERAVGRRVRFAEIGVSLRGGAGVRLRDLRVADDPAYSREDFAEVGEAVVRLRLWPLLRGRVEVGRVVLRSPRLSVIRDERGFNFATLGGAAAPAPEKPGGPAAAAPAAGAAFLVSVFELHDATVRYVDRRAEPARETTVRGIELEASDVGLDRQVSVSLRAALLGAEEPNASVEGRLGPLAGAGGALAPLDSVPFELRLRLEPLVVERLRGLPGLEGALPAELSAPDPLRLELSVDGPLAELAFRLSLDATDARLAFGRAFRKPRGTRLELAASGGASSSRLTLERLSLALGDGELKGEGRVERGPPTSLDLRVSTDGWPLEQAADLAPALSGADLGGRLSLRLHLTGPLGSGRVPAVSGRVGLADVRLRSEQPPLAVEGITTELEVEPRRVVLPRTRLRVGGAEVELEARAEGELTGPRVRATLRAERLPLAALGAGEAGAQAQAADELRALAADLSLDATRSPPGMDLHLRAGGGRLAGLPFESLEVVASRSGPAVRLRKVEVSAFEGGVSAEGRLELASGTAPRFSLSARVDRIDLASLLAAELGAAAARLRGRLTARLELEGAGSSWEELRPALRGQGRVDVADGVLEGVNLVDEIVGGVTGVPGLGSLTPRGVREKYPALFGTGDTRFERMGASVRIADGVARTDDLVAAAPEYELRGRGTYRLDNRADLRVTLRLAPALAADIRHAVREAAYLVGGDGWLVLPARVVGSPPALRAEPDLEAIARTVGGAALQKGIERLLGGGKGRGQERGTGAEKGAGRGVGKKAGEPAAPGARAPIGRAGGDRGGGAGGPPDPTRELIEKGLEGLFGH